MWLYFSDYQVKMFARSIVLIGLDFVLIHDIYLQELLHTYPLSR